MKLDLMWKWGLHKCTYHAISKTPTFSLRLNDVVLHVDLIDRNLASCKKPKQVQSLCISKPKFVTMLKTKKNCKVHVSKDFRETITRGQQH